MAGAEVKKPTTLWIRNFEWRQPLMCNSADGYCDAVIEHGGHLQLVSYQGSLAEKWVVPYNLCLELLQCMQHVKQGATWFLTIFGSALQRHGMRGIAK